MLIDEGRADWLTSPSLETVVTAGGVAWGTRGITLNIESPIDLRVDAQTIATLIAAFMGGGPLVKDRVVVMGRRRDLLLKPVSLTGDRLGYSSAAVTVFVIGVVENDDGTTSLTVLRKL